MKVVCPVLRGVDGKGPKGTSSAAYPTKQGALEAVILPHVRERQAYRIKKETLEKLLSDSVATH